MKTRTFRGKVRNADKLRQEFEAGTATGDVEIIVAVFDVPDTHVAVGNDKRQIIDQGAFREWIQNRDFENDPPPGFIDHGGAVANGVYSVRDLIGFASEAEETEEGLLLRTHYNLGKQVGREAYSDLVHNPKGVQFSFSWDDEDIELRDGNQHAVRLSLSEWSQVAFGAQRKAHLVSARAKATNLGGESLETLPNEVRGAWFEQLETIARSLEKFGWVEEVFTTNEARTEGFVVTSFEDRSYGKVPWMRMEDDTIGFDTTKSEELEQEWVTTGKALTGEEGERAAALASRSPASLEAAVESVASIRADLGNDPIVEFYRTITEELGSLTKAS